MSVSFIYVFFFFQEISKQIEGHTICALGDGAAWPVQVSTGLSKLLFTCIQRRVARSEFAE